MINLKGNTLKKNAVINVVRQLATIIFPMITFPYISRIMGSENYGKLNFTGSIISYISLIAALGINNYAIREGSRVKEDKYKRDRFIGEIVTLNFLAMILAYFVLTVILLFFVHNPDYRVLLIIQGITVFFNVIGCEWLNSIYEDYLFITVRYIILQSIAVVLMLIFVKQPSDIFIYAVISQFANIVGSVVNIAYFRNKRGIKLSFVFDKSIFAHLKPVMILFGNAASMLIYVNSDKTILGIFSGDEQVGYYSVAVKIYTVVKQLLNALLIVGIPRMARWTGVKEKSEIDSQLDRILSTLLTLLFPCVFGLFSLSDSAILILAGAGYESAQIVLKILSVTLVFATGVCFYSNLVLIPNDMEKHILKATMISAVLNIVLNFIFIPSYGIVAAACTTLLSECVSVGYMLWVSREKYFPHVKRTFFQSLLSGIIILIICQVVRACISNFILQTSLSILLSILFWITFRKITNLKIR